MIRITRIDGSPEATLRIEGRITRLQIGALREACEECLAERGALVLDLSRVDFADETGVQALRELTRAHAALVGCSPFLHALLQEKTP